MADLFKVEREALAAVVRNRTGKKKVPQDFLYCLERFLQEFLQGLVTEVAERVERTGAQEVGLQVLNDVIRENAEYSFVAEITPEVLTREKLLPKTFTKHQKQGSGKEAEKNHSNPEKESSPENDA